MAYTGEYLTIPGFKAGASLTTKQYTPVKIASTAGEVVSATATTEAILGILMNDPADGDAAEVAVLGQVKAVAGTSTITAGLFLSANSTGVINTTADNTRICGVALEAAAAAGNIITILLTGPARH